MEKSLTELISGYVCRCNTCEEAGEFKLIGRDLDVNMLSEKFSEIYGNFVLQKIHEELKLLDMLPKPDWTAAQTLDYQARLATRSAEIKNLVLNTGVKQFALTFEENNSVIVCRCPDCNEELVRIER